MKEEPAPSTLAAPLASGRASRARRFVAGGAGAGFATLGLWLLASGALLPVVIAIWILAGLLILAAILGRPSFLRETEDIATGTFPPIG